MKKYLIAFISVLMLMLGACLSASAAEFEVTDTYARRE